MHHIREEVSHRNRDGHWQVRHSLQSHPEKHRETWGEAVLRCKKDVLEIARSKVGSNFEEATGAHLAAVFSAFPERSLFDLLEAKDGYKQVLHQRATDLRGYATSSKYR